MASKQILHEGPIFMEMAKNDWVECYSEVLIVSSAITKFVALEKLRPTIPASRSNSGDMICDETLIPGDLECKIISLTVSALGVIRKNCSQFPENPCFLLLKTRSTNKTYRFATSSDFERNKWAEIIKRVAVVKSTRNVEMSNGSGIGGDADDNINSNSNNKYSNSNGVERRVSLGRFDGTMAMNSAFNGPENNSKNYNVVSTESPIKGKPSGRGSGSGASSSGVLEKQMSYTGDIIDDASSTAATSVSDAETTDGKKKSKKDENDGETRFLGIKIENLVRFVKVFLAFPFVIVSTSVQVTPALQWFKSIAFMRFMNLMIYVIPLLMVEFILKTHDDINIHRLVIGIYILIYLIPVATVAFAKLKVSSSTHQIEEGTFCFKPSRSVRWSQGNFYALGSAVFEWIQHVLYVLPTTITTRSGQSRLKDYPPYLSFEIYFWGSVFCTFACGLIMILNSVLRGKAHYKFQKSGYIWFFLYNVGTPMYVTFVTILFMGLLCDHSTSPSVLVQDPDIVCYSERHLPMARAALMSLGFYLIQNTLLPSGTFKETMRDDDLDIMFVPVYLQVHFLFKAIFSGIYVFFYQNNLVRAIVLTIINLTLLGLNNFMKPCSVEWVNTLRDTFLMHASLSGIQALNYLAFPPSEATRGMVISTLSSNIFFASIAMFIYFKYTNRSTEYNIAKSFLDLEWQVSRGGSVHPRVLEPLISLTLSPTTKDWEIAKKYINQLVWLISYPNMRVQFQSAWGLANLALCDEDSRIKIHEAGGTKTLFEWYTQMGFVVQLEALAALANLSLSRTVTDDMVTKFECIPFFVELVASNKVKHSQFACIALANVARSEDYRDKIRKAGGIQAFVSCIMSNDYYRRRYGCLALANVALSQSKEIQQVFESKGLIDRIIKMALRKEVETQREVIALIRNLCCHNRLRALLLERDVLDAIDSARDSVYEEVRDWCGDILTLMNREIILHNTDFKHNLRTGSSLEIFKGPSETDYEILQRMIPLDGQVEWSTWGSKLENMFSPIFATLPPLEGFKIVTSIDEPCTIYLNKGLPKSVVVSNAGSYSFSILERPTHGLLGDLQAQTSAILYTPFQGFNGTDFFTFRLTSSGITSWPATISITVGTSESSRADDDVNEKASGDIELGHIYGGDSSGANHRNEGANNTNNSRSNSSTKTSRKKA